MNKIEELEKLAEDYRLENNKGWHNNSQINSGEFIEMYLQWFMKSKILFTEHFKSKNELLKEFSEYKTDGNGIILGGQFIRQYPVFTELIKQIKEDEVKNPNHNKEKNIVHNKCFLIHGHNDSLKNEIARFIEKEAGIEVIILHEQPNRGRTIIEKFEASTTVDFAIALWTNDDEGKAKSDNNLRSRPRQNVILETGFFFGRLGREKVIVLIMPEVEIPSDYSGMVYISLKNNWKHDLISEIKSIYE